jgi:hypothetical protein
LQFPVRPPQLPKRLEYALIVLAIIGVVVASTAFMSQHLAERTADRPSRCDVSATC